MKKTLFASHSDRKLRQWKEPPKINGDFRKWLNMPRWLWALNACFAIITVTGKYMGMKFIDGKFLSDAIFFLFLMIDAASLIFLSLFIYCSLRYVWKKETSSFLKPSHENEILVFFKMILKMMFFGLIVGGIFFIISFIFSILSILTVLGLLVRNGFPNPSFADDYNRFGRFFDSLEGIVIAIGLYYFHLSRATHLFIFRIWSEPQKLIKIVLSPPLFAQRQIIKYLGLLLLWGVMEIAHSVFFIASKNFEFLPKTIIFFGFILNFLRMMSFCWTSHALLATYLSDYRAYILSQNRLENIEKNSEENDQSNHTKKRSFSSTHPRDFGDHSGDSEETFRSMEKSFNEPPENVW